MVTKKSLCEIQHVNHTYASPKFSENLALFFHYHLVEGDALSDLSGIVGSIPWYNPQRICHPFLNVSSIHCRFRVSGEVLHLLLPQSRIPRINTSSIVATTATLLQNVNDHPFLPLTGEDVRSPGNNQKQKLCKHDGDCKTLFHRIQFHHVSISFLNKKDSGEYLRILNWEIDVRCLAEPHS